jgi:DNA-binding SARP family transcriptional activator
VGLRFEVLGPVRAWRGDAEVELGSPQQRAILAILLLRGGAAVAPDELVHALWGESAPRAAVGMVRSYVSRLRRALDSTVIESVGGGYALPVGEVDLVEFQRLVNTARDAQRAGDRAAQATALRSALTLWKGTPLAGVRGEYADFERTRLTQLRLAAIEDLAAADVELGRHVEAAVDLAAVVSEEPFRERPRELLMLALYRSGRQAEALAVFHETQRVLADELGIDPGPDLQAMHQRILGSDPALAAHTVATKPAQLPPDLPDFVGRADLLVDVVNALSSSVVGIVGLAGVGKTALATHAGHAVADRFPDGQFFVDLSADPHPLAGLLRSLGVGVPESPAERVALWRTHTAGRRMLVVLDGAHDAEQVLSVLPGSGVAVMITARQRFFGLPSVRWMKVDGLREDESRTLLEHVVGADRVRAEPDTVAQLLRSTAGLPQVLRAVGVRIAARPGWTFAAAGKRISKPDPRATQPAECGEIERPYESALLDLTPAQARTFRLVSLADSPDITAAAAAALLDLPVGETETLLESLVDMHLVEPSGLDRYRYHHPVRAFARAHASMDEGEAECQAALARLVRFYATAQSVPSRR